MNRHRIPRDRDQRAGDFTVRPTGAPPSPLPSGDTIRARVAPGVGACDAERGSARPMGSRPLLLAAALAFAGCPAPSRPLGEGGALSHTESAAVRAAMEDR